MLAEGIAFLRELNRKLDPLRKLLYEFMGAPVELPDKYLRIG